MTVRASVWKALSFVKLWIVRHYSLVLLIVTLALANYALPSTSIQYTAGASLVYTAFSCALSCFHEKRCLVPLSFA